jgi:hypothetical protein
MPGPSDIARGNIQLTMVLQVAIPAGAPLLANTAEERTYAAPGVLPGDVVMAVNKPTFQGGIGIVNMRVSAANILAITFGNFTAATPSLTAEPYLVVIARPQNQAPQPTAIV